MWQLACQPFCPGCRPWPALKKSKLTIDSYRIAVDTYRNAENKAQKREMEKLIRAIKNDFSTGIAKNNPLQAKIDRLGFELFKLTGKSKYGTGLMLFEPEEAFGKDKNLKKKRAEKARKLEAEINKYTARLNDIKENRIYENAFEWRFEFPEVLDEDGNFTGFDIVIGNPPYIRQEEFSGLKAYLKEHYETYAGTADLYVYFVERGLKVGKVECAVCFYFAQ